MLKGVARVWFNSESFQTIPTFHSMRVRFHSESNAQDSESPISSGRPKLDHVIYKIGWSSLLIFCKTAGSKCVSSISNCLQCLDINTSST